MIGWNVFHVVNLECSARNFLYKCALVCVAPIHAISRDLAMSAPLFFWKPSVDPLPLLGSVAERWHCAQRLARYQLVYACSTGATATVADTHDNVAHFTERARNAVTSPTSKSFTRQMFHSIQIESTTNRHPHYDHSENDDV